MNQRLNGVKELEYYIIKHQNKYSTFIFIEK